MIGLAAKADHHLVGEVHEHEKKDEERDSPGPFEGPILDGHATCLPAPLAHQM
jgi:hypothetical protein